MRLTLTIVFFLLASVPVHAGGNCVSSYSCNYNCGEDDYDPSPRLTGGVVFYPLGPQKFDYDEGDYKTCENLFQLMYTANPKCPKYSEEITCDTNFYQCSAIDPLPPQCPKQEEAVKKEKKEK